MRFLISLFLLFWTFTLKAQPEVKRTMHRIQDTTKNKSGLYYGRSSKGHFSILLPIPFNDFTLVSDTVVSHAIGSKTLEGIKFSAIETIKWIGFREINLDSLAYSNAKASYKISNIRKLKNATSKSVSFHITGNLTSAICKYIFTKTSFFTLIVEYPNEYKEFGESAGNNFFDSLRIYNL